MDRQAQFRAREALIFQVAEQLLLENGEAGMTLDALAAELDLAKGTLYKHFQSKDELYMLLIIRNEKMLLEMIKDTDKQFPEHLAFFYVTSFASSRTHRVVSSNRRAIIDHGCWDLSFIY